MLIGKGVRDCFSETVIESEDIDFIIGPASFIIIMYALENLKMSMTKRNFTLYMCASIIIRRLCWTRYTTKVWIE